MANFQEIVAGPVSLYWAPLATAFPAVDTAPGGSWTLIGSSGADNYIEDDGVAVETNAEYDEVFGLGRAAPIKALRTKEELIVKVSIMDLTASQVRLALGQNAVTQTASGVGIPGTDEIELARGLSVNEIAVLIRGTGISPSLAAGNVQFELPRAYEAGSRPLKFVKNEPVGIELEFHALWDDVSGRLARYVVQTAVAG